MVQGPLPGYLLCRSLLKFLPLLLARLLLNPLIMFRSCLLSHLLLLSLMTFWSPRLSRLLLWLLITFQGPSPGRLLSILLSTFSQLSEVQKGKLLSEEQAGLQADVSRVLSAHPVWLEQTLPRISEPQKGRKAVLAWVQACLRCAQGGGCWWVNDKQRISVQERRVPGSSLEESN
jgi:hypothetical protein